ALCSGTLRGVWPRFASTLMAVPRPWPLTLVGGGPPAAVTLFISLSLIAFGAVAFASSAKAALDESAMAATAAAANKYLVMVCPSLFSYGVQVVQRARGPFGWGHRFGSPGTH